jgi:hypothetical protein
MPGPAPSAQHLAGADAAEGPESTQDVLLWKGRGAAPLSSIPLGGLGSMRRTFRWRQFGGPTLYVE